MAERKIYCADCKKYMGVILDAKLRKGTVYLCDKCWNKVANPGDMPDFMKDLFR